MVRGDDGAIVYSYARERRVQLRFVDFPRPLINAFLSAEDKNFWTHGGVDYVGTAEAVVDYVVKHGSGQRARGGSTITQQVAKNILIGNEYSVGRKLREMLVARRIEGVLTKQQILELYLNEIPLGPAGVRGAGGVRGPISARMSAISALAESAFLAILPKGAGNLWPGANSPTIATWRGGTGCSIRWSRTAGSPPADAETAKAAPLGVIARRSESLRSRRSVILLRRCAAA